MFGRFTFLRALFIWFFVTGIQRTLDEKGIIFGGVGIAEADAERMREINREVSLDSLVHNDLTSRGPLHLDEKSRMQHHNRDSASGQGHDKAVDVLDMPHEVCRTGALQGLFVHFNAYLVHIWYLLLQGLSSRPARPILTLSAGVPQRPRRTLSLYEAAVSVSPCHGVVGWHVADSRDKLGRP